jgi:O-antigen/teichoic acid export membrane protein
VNSDRLGRRVTWSAFALVLRALIVMGVGVARVAVVARVLGPKEMGTFALLSVVVEAARALTTLGPRSVIVQRSEITRAYVDTYWVFSVAQGTLIAALALIATPLLGLAQPETSWLTLSALVAVAVFISGWESPGRMLAERDVRFPRIVFGETLVAVLDFVIVAALALWLKSALALAVGAIVRAAIEVSLSFILFPVAVSLRADRDARREYLKAGGHLLLLTLGSYVTIYGDNASIGALLGAQALGFYVVAYRLAELPFSAMFAITRRLLFPILSRLQADKARWRAVMLDSFALQMLALWPAAVGLCVFADSVILLVYGPQYTASIVVLRALLLLSIGRGMTTMIGTVLLSEARYDYVSRLKWMEVSFFLPGVLTGIYFGGLVGAALGAGGGYLAAGIVRAITLCRDQKIGAGEALRAFALPGAVAGVAATAGFAVQTATTHRFWLPAAAFVGAYIALALLLERRRLRRIVELMRNRPA